MLPKNAWPVLTALGLSTLVLSQSSCSKPSKAAAAPKIPTTTETVATPAGPEGWTTDLEKALAKAKTQNKPVLLEFTGSDWCPQCIVLTKNIFATEGFIDAATKKFILVELDVPFGGIAKPEGDVEEQNRNTKYSSTYRVNEFPTIILMSPEGKEFHRFLPADFPKTDLLLKHLDEELAKMPANPS